MITIALLLLVALSHSAVAVAEINSSRQVTFNKTYYSFPIWVTEPTKYGLVNKKLKESNSRLDPKIIQLDDCYSNSAVSFVVLCIHPAYECNLTKWEFTFPEKIDVLKLLDYLEVVQVPSLVSKDIVETLMDRKSNVTNNDLEMLHSLSLHFKLSLIPELSLSLFHIHQYHFGNPRLKFIFNHLQKLSPLSFSDLSIFKEAVTYMDNLKYLSLFTVQTGDALQLLTENNKIQLTYLKGTITYDTDVTTIVSYPQFKLLETLEFTESLFTTYFLKKIADSLEHLKVFSLGRYVPNQVNPQVGKIIAESKNFQNLEELYFDDCPLYDADIVAISESVYLTKLIHFRVKGSWIRYEGIAALAKSNNFRNLETLTLKHTLRECGDKVSVLLDSPKFPNLKSLDLSDNSLGVESAKSLANSYNMMLNLNILDFSKNDIGDEGAKLIAKSDRFSKVNHLYLEYNEIQLEGANALATSSNFANMVGLSLNGNSIGVDGVKHFAYSKTLPENIKISFFFNGRYLVGTPKELQKQLESYLPSPSSIVMNVPNDNFGSFFSPTFWKHALISPESQPSVESLPDPKYVEIVIRHESPSQPVTENITILFIMMPFLLVLMASLIILWLKVKKNDSWSKHETEQLLANSSKVASP